MKNYLLPMTFLILCNVGFAKEIKGLTKKEVTATTGAEGTIEADTGAVLTDSYTQTTAECKDGTQVTVSTSTTAPSDFYQVVQANCAANGGFKRWHRGSAAIGEAVLEGPGGMGGTGGADIGGAGEGEAAVGGE